MPPIDGTEADPYVPNVDPLIKSLIPAYLENRKRDLGKLDQAVAESDFKALQKLGHDMKGSGGSYGLTPISHIGAEIEAAALANDLERVRTATMALATFLSRIVLPD